MAAAGCGEISAFRAALEEREPTYVVEVKAMISAYAEGEAATRPAYRGSGRRPALRYRRPPASQLHDLQTRGLPAGRPRRDPDA